MTIELGHHEPITKQTITKLSVYNSLFLVMTPWHVTDLLGTKEVKLRIGRVTGLCTLSVNSQDNDPERPPRLEQIKNLLPHSWCVRCGVVWCGMCGVVWCAVVVWYGCPRMHAYMCVSVCAREGPQLTSAMIFNLFSSLFYESLIMWLFSDASFLCQLCLCYLRLEL